MKRLWRVALGSAALLAVLAGAGLYALLAGLPSPQALAQPPRLPSIRLVDRKGRLLYEAIDAHGGRQMVLPLERIPLALQQATIATEDRHFYQNPGVDLAGIARAAWINLRGGEVLAGGSTITQQVTRNLLLANGEQEERTLRRKLRESWLAWRVARSLGKEEVLALYLNQIYYGAMAYGVEAAAQTYFGKPAGQLTLAESALIAGLPQAPGAYNPFLHPEAAKARQESVLKLMLKAGFISQAEHDLALRQPLRYATTPYPVNAPHFVMMVLPQVDALFSREEIAASGGLTVFTTLDLDWQEQGERIVREQVARLNRPPAGGQGHNVRNAALVALDPHSGAILALVGNVDYFDAGIQGAINMALAPRQPGSAIKPLIYAAALSPEIGVHGQPWTAATMLPDVRAAFPTAEGIPYVPVNYSREESGPVLLRQALGSSLNIPAVVTLEEVGLEPALKLAARLGLGTLGDPADYGLSFALGGGAVRLLDLAAAFAAFANGGRRATPYAISKVVDAAGRQRFLAQPEAGPRVLDERVAWLISDILSDNQARMPAFGEQSVLRLDRTAAAKTGTTNDFRDNWALGYTPDLVVAAWVGNADNEPMRQITGISGAGPIWHDFMRTVLAGVVDKPFRRPPGLVQVEVCALSGLLPTEACPYRRQEWFLAGTQPVARDTFFRRLRLDVDTGLPAAEGTPPGRVREQLVLDLPARFQPWARERGLPLWSDYSGSDYSGPDHAVLAGENGAPQGLRLAYPDPGAVFVLSPALPAAAQQIPIEAVVEGGGYPVTLWLDGAVLARLEGPPFRAWWPLAPGEHRVWAEGVDGSGRPVRSPEVLFTVRER